MAHPELLRRTQPVGSPVSQLQLCVMILQNPRAVEKSPDKRRTWESVIAEEVHSQTQDSDRGLAQSWCQRVGLVLIPKADEMAQPH